MLQLLQKKVGRAENGTDEEDMIEVYAVKLLLDKV